VLAGSRDTGQILITSDADFIAANGVSGGSGTPSDPYIITDLSITDMGNPFISVTNTTKHFVIKNTVLRDTTASSTGIYLTNVTNCTITNVSFDGLSLGVRMYLSGGIEVEASSFDKTLSGVYIGNCTEVRVGENEFNWNDWKDSQTGVAIHWSNYVTVEDNSFSDGYIGVHAGVMLSNAGWNLSIEKNTFTNLWFGIKSQGLENSRIISNTFMDHERLGIWLQDLIYNVTISDNRFEDLWSPGMVLAYSREVKVTGNSIINASSGIFSYRFTDGLIGSNEIIRCRNTGITLLDATGSEIVGNRIVDCDDVAINLSEGGANRIYHNDFIGNNRANMSDVESQAIDGNPEASQWDNGREGNHWSDYEDRYPDATSNGRVWSIPYDVDTDLSTRPSDLYPLVAEVDLVPPVAIAGDNMTVDVGTTFTLNATASQDDSGKLNITWTVDPEGLNIRSHEPEFSLAIDVPGRYLVILNASDPSGLWTIDSLWIDVVDRESPTIVEDLSDATATTGDVYTARLRVEDNIGIRSLITDEELWSPVDVDASGNGVYEWKIMMDPSNMDRIYFIVTVSDLSGTSIQRELRTPKVVDNDPPEINHIDSVEEALKGMPLTIAVEATDNVGVIEIYLMIRYGDGPSKTSFFSPEYSPVVDVPRHPEGDLVIQFVARDIAGNRFTTPLYVIPLVNAPPLVDDLPTWDVTEETDAEYDLAPYVSDANDEVLTLSCSDESVTIEGMVLKLRHDVAVPDRTVTLTIMDGEDQTDADLIIHVINVNDPPVIEDVSTVDGPKFKVDEKVTFTINVTDEDLDELTVTWKDGDTVLGTGETIVYQKLKPGKHTITVTVFDGEATVEETLEVVIKREEESPGPGLVVALAAVVLAGLVRVRRWGKRPAW